MELMVIGTGKMAEAIISGASDSYEITIVGRDFEKITALMKKYPNISGSCLLDSPVEIEGKDLILAVKPYALESVSLFLSGNANSVISVLAGVSLDELRSKLNARYFIRAMPNIAAYYKKSMTTLYGDYDFKDDATKICESFGSVFWLDKESDIDVTTAVAGSGIAFLAMVSEAIEDGAVKEGLKRDCAKQIVAGLFEGFGDLVKNIEPSVIKNEVMSPGGTTAAGYFELEDGKVRSSFIKAIMSATKRARG